jgi:hypothetical protein
MGLENLGSILVGEVVVQELVVSFPPSHFQLSFLQCIKLCFFRHFLQSSLGDFMDDQQVQGDEGTVFDPECLMVLEECLGHQFEEDSCTLSAEEF